MDLTFLLLAYIVFNGFIPVVTELRLDIAQEHCGQTFDLAVEGRLILDYGGSELNGECKVTVTNTEPNKMICIEVDESRSSLCTVIMKYYTGQIPDPGIQRGYYSCYSFYNVPLCREESQVFAVFESLALLNPSIYAEIYTSDVTTTYSPAPTSTFKYVKEEESYNSGMIIGIFIGVVILLISIVLCAKYSRRGTEAPDYSAHYQQGAHNADNNAQHQQETHNTDQSNFSAPPPTYSQVMSQPYKQISTISTVDGYQVHPRVNLLITDPHTTPEHSISDTAEPTAPPPPYPGT